MSGGKPSALLDLGMRKASSDVSSDVNKMRVNEWNDGKHSERLVPAISIADRMFTDE